MMMATRTTTGVNYLTLLAALLLLLLLNITSIRSSDDVSASSSSSSSRRVGNDGRSTKNERRRAASSSSSFASVNGRRLVEEQQEEFKRTTKPLVPFGPDLSLQDGPKRPCKRVFTSVDGQFTLAQFNRDSGRTRLINFYDKPFVNTMEYDFLTDSLLGMVNGTVLAEIGHRQAHVRIRGDTGVEFIQSMAISSYGEVFGYSPVDTAIYVIDKFTGESTSLGQTGLENMIDMAYWFQADLVFATDGEILFVIDIINRALGDVGPISGLPDGQRIQSLVITPQGTLFGVTDEFEDATIWEIEKFSAQIVTSRDPVSSSLPSAVSGGTLRCPVWRLPPNAFPPREPTPSPDPGPPTPSPDPGPPTPSPTPGAPTVPTVDSWNTDIDLDNVVDQAKPAFEAANLRWDNIITEGAEDIPDVSGNLDPCVVPTFIDDLWICASIEEIDGPSGVLGFAGPVATRADTGIPFAGLMVFDEDDVDRKIEEGEFTSIVLHEMAHVFGIGTLWTSFGLADNNEAPCNYVESSRASAEYQELSGCAGEAVPIENDGGQGTACGHWDEDCFIDELMTGFLTGIDQPLSRLTIAGFDDLGYSVDYDLADPYDSSRMSSSCLCAGGGVTEKPRYREPISAKGYREMISAGRSHLAKMSSQRETWESTTPGNQNTVYVADKVVLVLYEDTNGVIYDALVRAA